MVRGLALRSLASLRQANLADHIFKGITTGLGDLSPYVRKTAVIGCAKLFYITPNRVRGRILPLFAIVCPMLLFPGFV
jgi:AP-4 complex subunit beta-1